jgi:hypothetical protein
MWVSRKTVAASLGQLSPDRLRAVITLLMAPTVAPVGKGGCVFNPERVKVEWKPERVKVEWK